MMRQTEHFNKKIQRYGCYFLSLLRICELRFASDEFTADGIQRLYQKLVSEGVMDEDCYILSPDAVLKAGFAELTGNERFAQVRQIGIEDRDGRRFWGWVKDNRIDYIILKKKRPNGFHFTLAAKNAVEIFDPHPSLRGEVLAKVFYHDFSITEAHPL